MQISTDTAISLNPIERMIIRIEIGRILIRTILVFARLIADDKILHLLIIKHFISRMNVLKVRWGQMRHNVFVVHHSED